MLKTIIVSPPTDFTSFSPSELFRFFFQIGRWTEDSFSDEFQVFTRGKLVSTVTINKWKNRDVIPTRYSSPFFKFIESLMEPDLAKDWVTAFETVWALHSAGRTKERDQMDASTLSDIIGFQHQKWINHIYTEKRAGESFSTSDLYVPLQLSDARKESPCPQDVEDLIDSLTGPKKKAEKNDWIFISGGPGSGKSMAALRIANTLCEEEVYPIYMRGSRLSNIDIDIVDPTQSIVDAFSAKSFLKHFRSSSFESAYLILDGLDEISLGSQDSTHTLGKLISDLKIEQTACAAHSKSLHIIALGRDAHVQFAADQVAVQNSQQFELLSLDGSLRRKSEFLGSIQGQDLRPLWWKKFLVATNNFPDPSLPDFLSTEYDDFTEFGSDPLLTYLICNTALASCNDSQLLKLPHERVNELTYSSNKNEIYRTVIDRLALSIRRILDPRRFLSVLQHMALAVWHNGNGRSVALQVVYDCIQDSETEASFRALSLSDIATQRPQGMLITTFYYRLTHDEQMSDQSVIEFTHKTFSEYLVSTLIFDRFIRLISAFGKKDEFEHALKEWIKLSYKGAHEPSLADFCQKEAAVRFETLSDLNWDVALTIIQNHIHGRHFEESGLSYIRQTQHSNDLLFFIWSCLNLERQKRTGAYFHLSNTSHPFSPADLKSFQRPNALSFESGSLTEPALRDVTFLTPALSAIHLISADMSQLSFSLGHIENAICEDTSFAMTHWSHVKVTAAKYIRSVFQQAIFHQWRVLNTHFSHCFFQGSRFQGTIFSACHFNETFFSQCHFSDVEFVSSQFANIIFDRCVFTQCTFIHDNNIPAALGIQFRHCTFMDMDTALQNIPAEKIENSIAQHVNEDMRPPLETIKVPTELDKIYKNFQ